MENDKINDEIVLNNITKEVNKYKLTKTDILDLEETILEMIDYLVSTEPTVMSDPCNDDLIIESVHDFISIQLQDIYGNPLDYYIKERINKTILETLGIYYILFSPKRSYGNTFIRKKPNISKKTKKLAYLSNIPQPDQRTDEWYIFRHKYLTASSIWKAFSTKGSVNQLIYNKCKPLNTSKFKGFHTDSPMHWGHKYEPVSIMWYEYIYETIVSDFGCIPHRNIEYIAASPDGINTSNKSDCYGRMLEVKNIVNRDITGIPKMEYWIQMQVQMEVCELNECDFLETRFKEYETEDDFYNDGNTFQKTKDNNYKGIILYFVKDGEALYEYAPFMCSEKEFKIWESQKMLEHKNITWIQNIYWRLVEISCVLVLRNKAWFSGALPILNNLWETIKKEKVNGYEHRAPKKKDNNIMANATNPNNEHVKNNCLIDVSSFQKKTSNKCIINIDTQTLSNAIYPHKLESAS